jgi:acyl-CoA synthetase (NDP forming)
MPDGNAPANKKRLANLRRLLSPRHVAFVGGSNLAVPIKLCLANGYAGQIWPVSPKYPKIAGLETYPTIEALPESPDATFIAVPRELTIEIVKSLVARDAGGAVCYAAGYAEVGGEGVELQKQLVAAAGDLALVGPNCYGLINYLGSVIMFASGPGLWKAERGAAIISQSGNIALTLTFNDRSVPFSYVISAGNQAVMRISDYIEGLADDPRVTAIGLYIEGLADIPAFSRAARMALAVNKPIVAFKAGRSELGAKLAMSHTSSLAGSDKLYDTLFERLGVIRVNSLADLMETIKYLSVAQQVGGDQLAVFTCSGGDSLMTADYMAGHGLTLSQFPPDQHEAIRAQLPVFASISNPLDYNTSLWGNEQLLTKCFDTVLAGSFDAGMLVLDYPNADPLGTADCDKAVASVIEAARRNGKQPIVATTLSETMPKASREKMIAAGCPPMQGLPSAIDAFAAGVRFARLKKKILADGAASELPAITPAPKATRLWSESEAKQALAGHGLTVPKGALAGPDEVAKAAASIGFPVVAKLAKPVLAHKTEAGAVALNIGDDAALGAAIQRMSKSVAAYRPGLVAEQFLVERQISGAVAELIIGVKRDDLFGLVLVIGAGGILVEMVEDAATLLLPVNRDAVAEAVQGLRVAKLLCGYRGRPAGDIEAVIDAVMAVAAFAEEYRDKLVELDVNPLLVMPKGQGAIAVDALVVMG